MRIIGIAILLLLQTVLCSKAQNLNLGLVACYPFYGNANDETGNGHHGTVYGPLLVNDRFGQPNGAYDFDGINDYIDIGLYGNISQSNSFSLSTWIQPNQVKTQTLFMMMPDDFYDRLNCMAYYSHNGVSTTVLDHGNCTAGGRLFIPGAVFSNAWQHWVYTVNPGNGMRVYMNGSLLYSMLTSSPIINRQRNVWIGGGIDVATAPFYFDGIIDDMRVYNRELTPNEVQILYGTELLCGSTGYADASYQKPPFEVQAYNGKVYVKMNEDATGTSLKIMNSSGRTLLEDKSILPGMTKEYDAASFGTGILIYAMQSTARLFTGKLFNY
ncbi:MAG: LamG domain-containing protein [Bacteroidetes bacterium]|nr:LamG domain-containing protein [Bacteroidota bacterium]